jgi:hypothetical protein
MSFQREADRILPTAGLSLTSNLADWSCGSLSRFVAALVTIESLPKVTFGLGWQVGQLSRSEKLKAAFLTHR